MKQASWSIQDIWNKKLAVGRGQVKERPYISASDIGMPFLDRFYKMKGVKPTNPFDERVLRIFDAGNTIEWLLLRVFRLAGILQDSQVKIVIKSTTKDILPLYGFLDAIVGGRPNWKESKKAIVDFIKQYNLKLEDEFIEDKAMKLVNALEKKYPKGLKPIVAEIKSVNSMAFHAHKNLDEAGFFMGYPHHRFQVYTYIRGQKIKEGRIFYVSRDDLCLQETAVLPTPSLVRAWWKDIRTMSDYFNRNVKPEREPDLAFNEKTKKWEANWRVGRSVYLTKITGEKDKATWEKKVKSTVNRRNRVIKIILKEATDRLGLPVIKLTKHNWKVIKEMQGLNKALDKLLPKEKK